MGFAFAQLAGVFEILDESGAPCVIIGGQAVNYWAETFLPAEPELERFLPFVSKDIDFLGGRQEVMNAARRLGLPARFPHKRMMTAFAGAVMWRSSGVEASIEFIRTIPGVSAADIRRWAVSSQRDGKNIRVLDPMSMLICKLNLALTVDQAKRRDGDHARILFICTRAFLRETLRGVEAGILPARGWLGAVERVLKLAESSTGKKAAHKLQMDWEHVLPELEIAASLHRTIVRFREQRLPQWREKVSRGWTSRRK